MWVINKGSKDAKRRKSSRSRCIIEQQSAEETLIGDQKSQQFLQESITINGDFNGTLGKR